MNEVFRGAFGSKLGPYDVKNHAGDDSEVRFRPKPCFRGVLNVFFFKKKTYFFEYFWLPIKIETPILRTWVFCIARKGRLLHLDYVYK